MHCQQNLPCAVHAIDALGLGLGLGERRKQHRREDGNDGNYDQQFNQRKPDTMTLTTGWNICFILKVLVFIFAFLPQYKGAGPSVRQPEQNLFN